MLQKECAALDCRLRPNCTTCFCLFFYPARCPRNAHEACANWNFLFPSQNLFLLFLPSAVDVRLPGLFCPRLVSFWPADRSPSGNAVFFHVGLLSLLERAITIPGETKSSILLNWPSLFSTCDVISGSWTLGNVCPVSVAVSVEFSLDTDLTTAGEIRDL